MQLQVVPIILSPGDALFFDGQLPHYTPKNVSNNMQEIIIKETALIISGGGQFSSTMLQVSANQQSVHLRKNSLQNQELSAILIVLAQSQLTGITVKLVLVCGRDYGGDYNYLSKIMHIFCINPNSGMASLHIIFFVAKISNNVHLRKQIHLLQIP